MSQGKDKRRRSAPQFNFDPDPAVANSTEAKEFRARGGETLRIIPLGGLGEIGKNTMAICYGEDIILVDAGLAFPSEEMLGVDLVLPDLTFLAQQQQRLRGLAVTHGHEDHIGGIPFLLKEVTLPAIYGPALAIGLLEKKLDENGLSDRTTLRQVRPRQRVKMGCFEVEFIRCTHSIADSYSLIIRTPVGVIVHTGDFKFDFTPVDGEHFDIAGLAAACEEGILALLSDSTNTEREGYTPSERTVWTKINEVFTQAKGRIIVTTFASNVNRMKQVLQAAINHHRKVAILGRSMVTFAAIARDLGYMSYPDNLLIPVENINSLPLDEVVILTTGSQGEPMSALTRIANDEHRKIKIEAGDTVIISATPIPGNERSVANTINALCVRGAKVIYGRDAGVHVSGHACREEQKLMLNLCKPKYFIPVHGEYRMLVRHGELAVECGVDPDNVFIMDNGDVLELQPDKGALVGKVQSGVLLVDYNRDFMIDEEIVEERQKLAGDGLVALAVSIDQDGKLLTGPDISLRGVILPRGLPAEEFVIRLTDKAKEIMRTAPAHEVSSADNVKNLLFEELTKYFQDELRSNPLLQVVAMRSSLSKAGIESEAKVIKSSRDPDGKGRKS
ncbi:MAG: ribonuclease J [Cyanobacteria bacterium SZAS LIN-3]|nr:ribonuclease J [Cyanobacteria bacterium SZAS LIN-3]MBS2009241.1 ribonuclease J [Cyanobacteria bacterium SZAS TMP-1]